MAPWELENCAWVSASVGGGGGLGLVSLTVLGCGALVVAGWPLLGGALVPGVSG